MEHRNERTKLRCVPSPHQSDWCDTACGILVVVVVVVVVVLVPRVRSKRLRSMKACATPWCGVEYMAVSTHQKHARVTRRADITDTDIVLTHAIYLSNESAESEE